VSLLAVLSTALLAPMLAIALWNLALATRLERAGAPHRLPRVSVLVPARNEAENLKTTLPALLRLEYPDLEILVLDDGSEDDSATVVAARRAGFEETLRLLAGRPLPQGWMGKCWGCHQLAEAASGEVLIFCDADVTPRPGALLATVAAMERGGAGVLTALPRQRLRGWVESAVVPLVAQLPVLAMLPLPLVPRLPMPALSMANGQWLAFTRTAYRACGGHVAVRGAVIEDVALARRAKACGQRLLPVVSTTLLEVRMYRDASSLREGFEKNLFALMGSRPLPFVAILLGILLVTVYPWVGWAAGTAGAAIPLALLVGVRGCGAVLFRHPLRAVLLHPLGSLLLPVLALSSYLGALRGTLRWKGRHLGKVSRPTSPLATNEEKVVSPPGRSAPSTSGLGDGLG